MKKHLTIFVLFGLLYMDIEIIYASLTEGAIRLVGQTSVWMMLVGGLLGLSIGLFNEIKCIKKIDYRVRTLLGGLLITLIELVSGVILNRWLGFGIWDYSGNFCNILGQTDLLHAFYWIAITPFGFWVDDVIRYYLFNEEKPSSMGNYYRRLFYL